MSRNSVWIALCLALAVAVALAAPSSSISIASAGGGDGSDDDDAVAFSGASSMTDSGGKNGGASSLLSRSGGLSSSQPGHDLSRTQTMIMGSNGDTTILQQSGDQPPKVYKISGNSSG